METFKTTRDIVAWLRKRHRRLSRFYAERRDAAGEERVRLLLDYVSRHEQALEKALADLEKEAAEGSLETYFQYVPEEIDDVNFETEQLQTPDMSVDTIIRIVVRNDAVLTRLYDRLAQAAPVPSVTDMFARLKEKLEQERARVVENAAHLKDV